MSSEKIRECSKCGWRGIDAKWSYCPFCNSTYYKCPYTARRGDGPLKKKRTSNAKSLAPKDNIDEYFRLKYKELGITPIHITHKKK